MFAFLADCVEMLVDKTLRHLRFLELLKSDFMPDDCRRLVDNKEYYISITVRR